MGTKKIERARYSLLLPTVPVREERKAVLSLGWGTQSFTLAAMSALGELPLLDACLHADTTHESVLTYDFAERWTPWLQERGIRVITVRARNTDVVVSRGRGVAIPAFVDYGGARAGMMRRQCTHDWKIAPIRRWILENSWAETVEQWIGISTDESLRMKPSTVKYIENKWPLIELGMSRDDCIAWLRARGLEAPPRSACTFCPYHTTEEWRRIAEVPEDMQSAISVDEAIRHIRPSGLLYVHPSTTPLEQINFSSLQSATQMRLWDEECEGLCGV